MAIKLQKAEEEMRIEKQKLKEKVLQIESMVAEAEVGHHSIAFVEIISCSWYLASSMKKDNKDLKCSVVEQARSPRRRQLRLRRRLLNLNRLLWMRRCADFLIWIERLLYVKYWTDSLKALQSHNQSRRQQYRPVRLEETRKPADSLNLDEFLAESNAAEMRKMINRKN